MSTKKITSQSTIRVGIDIGGTFTDFVTFNPASGDISSFKLPSTPHDPSEAVLAGIMKLSNQSLAGFDSSEDDSRNLDTKPPNNSDPFSIIHGSTVATNALLERKGATTALITTQGFKDVIQIGRQSRPDLYNFAAHPPVPLIPSELRFEVEERVDQFGNINIPLNLDDVSNLIATLQSSTSYLQSIAVCFLFSFTNPTHEQVVTENLRNAGFFVSASHEILPEYREYERTSTTVVNAYVSPVLDRYLAKLETSLNPHSSKDLHVLISNLQIMQSNGGSISVPEARKSGVRCILSGPAGGVVGCQFIGQISQRYNKSLLQKKNLSTPSSTLNTLSTPSTLRLLTFDMGGTSTDVSLIDGELQVTNEAEVGGLPIRVPVLDIHTIGAGGGSIAYIDSGGALRVGPESAGADPGPASYGRHFDLSKNRVGSENLPIPLTLRATVTDANLILGRIPSDRFLGGEMPLYPQLAEAAISPLASQLQLSLTETALGVIEIANAHMERALRVISVERGHDPRQFTLLSFGGAGSLHAVDLARRLSIPQVLIPPYAATLSAFGMLAANVVKDYTQTVMLPGDTSLSILQSQISSLLERAKTEIQAEGFSDEKIQLEPALDMRYRGQSYELTIPFSETFREDFHESHHRTYGYQRPGSILEIVNIRVRATGVVTSPQITPQPFAEMDPVSALIEHRPVMLAKNQKSSIPFYQGELLNPGNKIHGPAIVLRDDTTILIGESDTATVDPFLNLLVEIKN